MGSKFEAAIIVVDTDAGTVSKFPGVASAVHCEETLYKDKTPRRDIVAVVFFALFIGLVGLVVILIVAFEASSGGDVSTGTYPVLSVEEGDSGPDASAGPPVKIVTVVREKTTTPTTRRDVCTSSPTAPPTEESTFVTEVATTTSTTTTSTTTTSTTTTSTTTTSTTTTTTTSKEPRVRELVCTVGYSAVTASMYPPDRYCDYLYYCDVVITGGRLLGVEEQTSWEQFQEQAKTYSRVKPGVAFDFRYITASKLDTARNTLNMLAQVNNIEHYGVLNIIGKKWHLRQAVNDMRPVFEKLKQFQENDATRKTIIAIASYNYTYFEMELYKTMIATAVNNFKVDSVIAVSSTGWMEDGLTCSAAPPSALEAPNERFPSLQLHSMFVSATYQYRNPLVAVGLSFELGALIYQLRNDTPSFRRIAYAPCVTAGITSQDAVCGQNPNAFDESRQSLGRSLQVVGGYLNATSKRDIVISEFNRTVITKFTEAERRFGPFRHKLSWLLFNVHLGDHMGRCGTGPFDILEEFCEVFKGSC